MEKLFGIFKEGHVRKKYRKAFRYARLVIKPTAFVFVVAGIVLFILQVLRSTGESMGIGGLVVLVVGAAFWLLDTLFSTAEDWEKLKKEAKEESEGTR